jgi:hypothetical protein
MTIRFEVWLYGSLAAYAGESAQPGHAALHLEMIEGATIRDLLDHLGIPADKKGIAFVNGQLTDMPGLDASRDRLLKDGDRVAFFDPKSMWPFQYRHGASISPELEKALNERGGPMHHSPASVKA